MGKFEEIKHRISNGYVIGGDTDWLIKQVGKLDKIKGLINDERLTKSETVDKISKIVNV